MQSSVSAPTWSPPEKPRGCLTSLRGNLEEGGKLPERKKRRRLKTVCIGATTKMSLSIPNLDA